VRDAQEDLTELIDVGPEQPMILHPGEFMLGSTTERIRDPRRHRRRLDGKSSARPPRASSSTRRPGSSTPVGTGHITLELSNVASLPITLYPGMKIGQISFFQMTTPADRPTDPRVSARSTRASVGPRRAGTRRTSRSSDESLRDERTAVLARIIIGLGITVIFFGIAGRRFFWLSKLIRSGQPAPRRWQGFRKVSETEVVEVAGQKKLLKWTVPGFGRTSSPCGASPC